VRTEDLYLDDAEVVLVSYGCSARTALEVVEEARANGLKAGMIRLITVWPFAERKIRELAATGRIKAFVVAEINCGQIVYEVERCAAGRAETILAGLMGGRIFTPDEIYKIVEEAAS
jgi:2-oxoglutarate ferredoxin oxidoreductase subunit alpha